jgi:large subunit ribosomal protein L22
MKAILKNYRQSPRKVRLVADSIKGKKVEVALLKLKFMPKRATEVLEKLIKSAAANAKENFDFTGELIVKNIEVNKGVIIKRSRARARGSAFRINKRTSNIIVTLAEPVLKKGKNAPVIVSENTDTKKTVKKVAKKTAVNVPAHAGKVAKKTVKKVAPKAN